MLNGSVVHPQTTVKKLLSVYPHFSLMFDEEASVLQNQQD
jgi:hypothetical protein